MSLLSLSSGRLLVRRLGAAVAAVALLSGATACSSDADSTSGKETSEAANKSKPDKGHGVPDGFPKEVPLPELQRVDVVKSGANDNIWSLMVTVDATLKTTSENLVASCQQQLEDAGFAVDESTSEPIEAKKDEWEVGFRSAMDGTLTISAIKN